jgi:membrane fusion protein, macrolide-specific efflux system
MLPPAAAPHQGESPRFSLQFPTLCDISGSRRFSMNFFRHLYGWVGLHRGLALLLLAAVLLLGTITRNEVKRAQGELSPPISRGSIESSVYGIGTVTANQSFSLRAGVTATITSIAVREGDAVKKGEKLLSLDTVVYRAPFDGTVTYLPGKVGENVFASSIVLTLVDLRDRYLLVSLEQQGALRVRPGQEAILSFDTLRQENFKGKVVSVYSNDNNFFARIDVKALPEHILPGMTADVAITLARHENALLVPVAALEDGKFVWVKRGLARREELKLGIVDKDVAEVLGGNLQEGERVLIRKQVQ